MDQVYRGQTIPVEENFFMTYFKACGALWQVAYNKMWPAGETGKASKEIDGKQYLIEIDAVDDTGAKVEPDKDSQFIRFRITTSDGNEATSANLETALVSKLREIQEKNLQYYVPKPADFDVPEER
jgi:hypothetical protein